MTLYEQRDHLGGTLRLAAAAPGRQRLALAVDWLEAQVRALPVQIQLGVTVTPQLVLSHAPAAVIVAVGGMPRPYPDVDVRAAEVPIVNPRQVLVGDVPTTPGMAVILDHIGDYVAMGVAEWLADHGWQVTIVTADMFVGQRLTASLERTPF